MKSNRQNSSKLKQEICRYLQKYAAFIRIRENIECFGKEIALKTVVLHRIVQKSLVFAWGAFAVSATCAGLQASHYYLAAGEPPLVRIEPAFSAPDRSANPPLRLVDFIESLQKDRSEETDPAVCPHCGDESKGEIVESVAEADAKDRDDGRESEEDAFAASGQRGFGKEDGLFRVMTARGAFLDQILPFFAGHGRGDGVSFPASEGRGFTEVRFSPPHSSPAPQIFLLHER